MNNDPIPVSCAIELLKQINSKIEKEEWDECIELSKRILHYIKLALDPKTCKTGIPHIDGVFETGRMFYKFAPKKVVRAMDRMNRTIKCAKISLR